MATGRKWTDADVAVARDKSLSHEQVAEKLGRSVVAVKSYRSHHPVSNVVKFVPSQRSEKSWRPVHEVITDYDPWSQVRVRDEVGHSHSGDYMTLRVIRTSSSVTRSHLATAPDTVRGERSGSHIEALCGSRLSLTKNTLISRSGHVTCVQCMQFARRLSRVEMREVGVL